MSLKQTHGFIPSGKEGQSLPGLWTWLGLHIRVRPVFPHTQQEAEQSLGPRKPGAWLIPWGVLGLGEAKSRRVQVTGPMEVDMLCPGGLE